MWVIEDYRDAPMVPIAIIPNEKLARAFADAACGDNAHVYEMDLPIVLESRLNTSSEVDDELDDARDSVMGDEPFELDVMLYQMRERPAANTVAPTKSEALRAVGAR